MTSTATRQTITDAIAEEADLGATFAKPTNATLAALFHPPAAADLNALFGSPKPLDHGDPNKKSGSR